VHLAEWESLRILELENKVAELSGELEAMKRENEELRRASCPPIADSVDEAKASADPVDEAKASADPVDEAKTSADPVDEAKASADPVDEAKASADPVDEEERKLIAILHVGPHKMGSTSLQFALSEFHDELDEDGFLVPGISDGEQRLYAAASYLRCPEGEVEPCPHVTCPLKCNNYEVAEGWRVFLSAIDTAREQGKNLILSAEDFDRPDVRVEELFDALHGFTVTTVVMYRHFFDWIASVHGHLRSHELAALKCASTGFCVGATAWEERRINTLADAAERYTPLTSWLTNETLTNYLQIFSPTVVERFSKFGKVHMIMIDTRRGKGTSEGTLEQALFCSGWSPKACSTARANAQQEAGGFYWRKRSSALERQNENDSQLTLALELAIVAANEGLLPATGNALNAANSLAEYMKNTSTKVPIRCLATHPGYTGPMIDMAAQLWDVTRSSAKSVLSLSKRLTGHAST